MQNWKVHMDDYTLPIYRVCTSLPCVYLLCVDISRSAFDGLDSFTRELLWLRNTRRSDRQGTIAIYTHLLNEFLNV